MEYYEFTNAMARADSGQMTHWIDRCRSEQVNIREKIIELNSKLAKQEIYEGQLRDKANQLEANDLLESATGCSMEGLDKLTVRGES